MKQSLLNSAKAWYKHRKEHKLWPYQNEKGLWISRYDTDGKFEKAFLAKFTPNEVAFLKEGVTSHRQANKITSTKVLVNIINTLPEAEATEIIKKLAKDHIL